MMNEIQISMFEFVVRSPLNKVETSTILTQT